ncbi:MAG: cold shock domain-containing protein [Anaerolineae bacterium]|nr:cold shock domain-containing protein [Anaerolineae bacterium]
MGFKDRILVCRRCGVRFLDTAAQQRRRAELNEATPNLCPGCRALEALLRPRRGVVRWFDARRGFGFIHDEEGGRVFVHVSALPAGAPPLHRGEHVEYVLERTKEGTRAVQVKRVTD